MQRSVSLPEDDARLILKVLETTPFSPALAPAEAKERHDRATHAIRAVLIDLDARPTK